MRLISFTYGDSFPRAGALLGSAIVDLSAAAPLVFEDLMDVRWSLLDILRGAPEEMGIDGAADIVRAVLEQIGLGDIDQPGESVWQDGDQLVSGAISIGGAEMLLPIDTVRLLAPVPRPPSLRVFSGFEQHTTALARHQGLHVSPAWYEFPAFAFGYHNAIYGPDAPVPFPRSKALDYELGLACVLGRAARDIAEEDAELYIAGYMIMNGWSARDVQREEFTTGLGAAKARDFATSLGPWLVTPDELEQYALGDGRYNLTMVARVNDIERSRSNLRDIFYTFGQMLAYASRDVVLLPGDIIASGAADGGSLLSITSGQGPWLVPGDLVELEVSGLGTLKNQVEIY